jgi:predicted AlkP superfamily phosphohydrolase/phosphomutase
VRRSIVLGLDGLDPRRARRLMAEGKLPHMKELARNGYFSELATTNPPLSPVAWSSFATGTNPAKHAIYDFLSRGPDRYTPTFSLAHTEKTADGKACIRLLRKSRPFWNLLGEAGIFSTILRIPGTFPPEPFHGIILAGQGIPDLRGTQGTGTLILEGEGSTLNTGSCRCVIAEREDMMIRATLPGPILSDKESSLSLTIKLDSSRQSAMVQIGKNVIPLQRGCFSDWTSVVFQNERQKAEGIIRLLLISVSPEFKLYVSPIHTDPRRPAFPISHPRWYSNYLAMLHGPYGTLGLAEDTTALEAGILDNDTFLKQAYDLQDERERIFLESLLKNRNGLTAGVFDLADRVQHMFMDNNCGTVTNPDTAVIDAAYEHFDRLVGKTINLIDDKTILFIVSDHGFTHIRRLIHLNSWLREAGFLAIKAGSDKSGFLYDVDWVGTRAFGLGLNGLHLNVQGRDPLGIVPPEDIEPLMREIAAHLRNLKDPETGVRVVHEVIITREVYAGPYLNEGPDLIIGWETGYRTAWESATGGVEGPIFTDNTRKWSGDHAVSADLVPGVLFCNRRLRLPENHKPHIMDLAPTIMALFGVARPSYLDGVPLEVDPPPAKEPVC